MKRLVLTIALASFVLVSAKPQQGASDSGHTLDTAKVVKAHIDSIARLPAMADSILFVKSGLGKRPDQTLARFSDANAIELLRKGIVALRDTGEGLSKIAGDTTDLSLVIFAPNEAAKRVITLARRSSVDPVSKKKRVSIVGVSLQYSVEAFAWITLSNAYADTLAKVYATATAKGVK